VAAVRAAARRDNENMSSSLRPGRLARLRGKRGTEEAKRFQQSDETGAEAAMGIRLPGLETREVGSRHDD
jgi:hypothetical protein